MPHTVRDGDGCMIRVCAAFPASAQKERTQVQVTRTDAVLCIKEAASKVEAKKQEQKSEESVDTAAG